MSLFPYAILSDIHLHGWTQFAKIEEDGLNSRLKIILDEIWRAAEELKEAGGKYMFLAGDVFHVRGKIEPSVQNPTLDLFKKVKDQFGIQVVAIPGNHDNESRETTRLGNAIVALEGVGVEVAGEVESFGSDYDSDSRVIMIPWEPSNDTLRARCNVMGDPDTDLIIHAPLNGVLVGIPDHGLSPEEVAAWGYKRVFCGHYHNHKVFENGKVISIGATTHQTWSDVGTKAGFLMVYEDHIEFRASQAPKFSEITDMDDEVGLMEQVDGNYVRVKIGTATETEIKTIRDSLMGLGALAVRIDTVKVKERVERTGAIKVGGSLLESVNDFVKAKELSEDEAKFLFEICADIYSESTAVEA